MRSSASLTLERRILTIHPSPYGSSLICSGASPSASLTSVISPESGATTSETALTDSTSAYGVSFFTVAPTSGGSKNTTSPSCSCAYQVMPIVAMSPSIRAQSCSAWYLRSDGYEASAKVLLLAVEGLLADLGGPGLAANVDLEGGAGLGLVRRQVGHADPDVEARAERAGRDHAAAGDGVALA